MRKKGQRLGAVVIAKNEEEDLPGLLTNLLGWVDELVVVDDQSTDRTLELLETAQDRVTIVRHPFDERHGFAGQRNAGIDAATADWLLHMDVDERVTVELKAEIDACIQNSDLVAYRYHRSNFFLHRLMKHGGLQRWNNPHLARRGLHRFEGLLHERCVVSAANVGQLQHAMWHLNDSGFHERLRKNVQYSEMEAVRLANGRRVRWHDLFLQPLKRATRTMLFDKGLLDGVPGLIWSLHTFSGTFNAYARAWDLQNPIARDHLEELVQGESMGWQANAESAKERDDT